MHIPSPKKFICRQHIDRNRDKKQRHFDYRQFRWPIACYQKKHPRQQDHAVTIGKLPAARVSMTPQGCRQYPDRDPSHSLIPPALTKKEEKKWTGNEDRTTKSIRHDVRKHASGVADSFENNVVNVPRDCVERE